MITQKNNTRSRQTKSVAKLSKSKQIIDNGVKYQKKQQGKKSRGKGSSQKFRIPFTVFKHSQQYQIIAKTIKNKHQSQKN